MFCVEASASKNIKIHSFMGVNEGPWEKHVAIISELQVERLESDNE